MIYLVIAFFIGGEWVVPDGWSARQQPSFEVCEERAYTTARYLAEHYEYSTAVQCVVVDEQEK